MSSIFGKGGFSGPFSIIVIVFVALWRVGVFVIRFVFRLGRGALYARRDVTCPSCSAVRPADATWECGHCHARQTGWVWNSCTICHRQSVFMPCDACGHAIRNPVYEEPVR